MEKKENNKLLKNYFVLICLFTICILFVLYLCKVYVITQEEKRKIPVIGNTLSQIYTDDLDHYVMDNPMAIIYMCQANDETCRIFERDFKKLINKYHYENQIIYLNLTDVNLEAFLVKFNNTYNYKVQLNGKYPAFVLFEDGKIKSILQSNSKSTLTVSKVRQFLELNEVGE